MKHRLILIVFILLIVIGIVSAIIILNNTKSTFVLNNSEDGSSFTVETENASEDSGGVGYITLSESQKIEVNSNLTDKSSIKLKILPSETDDNITALKEETIIGKTNRELELPSGSYTIYVTIEKKATGNMNVNAK